MIPLLAETVGTLCIVGPRIYVLCCVYFSLNYIKNVPRFPYSYLLASSSDSAYIPPLVV